MSARLLLPAAALACLGLAPLSHAEDAGMSPLPWLDPSLPVGQNGTKLTKGMTMLVDIAFNHQGYLTDCSRTFSVGKPLAAVRAAHQCCVDIQAAVAEAMRPRVPCEELYQLALKMADQAGYADRFMGLSQKAKFIGHGTGLYINEWPVIGARHR